MWIVMTSSAKMPNSCRGTYRNVAIVNVRYDIANAAAAARGAASTPFAPGSYGLPAMVSDRARGVICPHGARSGILHFGHQHVGKGVRDAYSKALAEAQARADRYNQMAPEAVASELFTYGGSA